MKKKMVQKLVFFFVIIVNDNLINKCDYNSSIKMINIRHLTQ